MGSVKLSTVYSFDRVIEVRTQSNDNNYKTKS